MSGSYVVNIWFISRLAGDQFGAGEAVEERFRTMNTSSPVRLVRIDIGDEEAADIGLDVPAGHRLWIEISKFGQVVGVVERSADEVGISAATIKDLIRQFADVGTSNGETFPAERLPKASVVVATIYRRVDLLDRAVKSLLDLDYPDYEIIVVDNRVGSGHTPIPEFSDDGRVRIVAEGTPGVSAARNRGVAESRGEFIAFTDDDVEVESNWLRELGIAFAEDPTIDAIGGMIRPSELETAPQLWFEEFYGGFTRSFRPTQWSLELTGKSDPMFPYSPGHFGAGCNMAVRRSAFDQVGFDVRLGGGTLCVSGEDLKVFLDILFSGGKLAYVPSAVVYHTHRRTEEQFMEQVYGYGVGLTAIFTDLITQDPRHLIRILKRVPLGMRMLLAPTKRRSPSLINSYPRRTQLVQLAGMAYGPIAFGRSAAKVRSTGRR